MADAKKPKGGILGLLLEGGGGKGSSDEEGPDTDRSGGDDRATMAAEDLLDAVKSDDPKALAAAFKRMYSACSLEPDSDDYDDEE